MRKIEKEQLYMSLELKQKLWRPSGLAGVRCLGSSMPGLPLYMRTESYRGDDLEADPSKARTEALWVHLHGDPAYIIVLLSMVWESFGDKVSLCSPG